MGAILAAVLIFVFLAFPIALLFGFGRQLQFPEGFFEQNPITGILHFGSVALMVIISCLLKSSSLFGIGLFVTLAVNTFILKIFSFGEKPPVVIYHVYLVLFWSGFFSLPILLGVDLTP